MPNCRIYGNDQGNTPYRVSELLLAACRIFLVGKFDRLLGTWHEFEYFQCGRFGCLQIVSLPENLADYYPSGYFSFRGHGKLARWAQHSQRA